MLRLLRKNLNFIILLVILKVSSSSLSDFIKTNDELKLSLLEYNYNNSQNVENITEDKKILKLIKKPRDKVLIEVAPEKKEVKVANFRNPEFFSDYIVDDSLAQENLIPVFENVLFSGVPIPQSKPYPIKKNSTRFEVFSVKDLKNLDEILKERLKFIINYKDVENLITNEINFSKNNNLKLFYSKDSFDNEILSEISIFKNNLFEVNAIINEFDRFVSQYIAAKTERKISRYRIKVYNSINNSLRNLNIPKEITKSFINQFSFSIDFQRDISEGDIIEILYEANYVSDNELVGEPNLLYASLDLTKSQKIELFRYKMRSGKVDYFDSYGKSIRKSIMRTPINGARLSSRFGMRKHPILGYSKMHRGIDFAAKKGTPIMAAGDGRISFAGRNGSYGKFIEIRHLNGFSTRYGHLSKFAKKIRKGTVIKQGEIIGFVGNSGRSTGPHLHYEVKHKRRIINPMTLKLPSKVMVEEEEIPNFYANISLTRERLSNTPITNSTKFSSF